MHVLPRVTVKRKAAVRPTLVSIAVPYAEPWPVALAVSTAKKADVPLRCRMRDSGSDSGS